MATPRLCQSRLWSVAMSSAGEAGRYRLSSLEEEDQMSEPVTHTLAVPGAVDQMLDNLIDNAVKASPRGSTVTVRAARADGRVEVHVIDQGPGLSDEERRHAFDRFWRSGANGMMLMSIVLPLAFW